MNKWECIFVEEISHNFSSTLHLASSVQAVLQVASTVWEPIRVMVANRLAAIGQDWGQVFSRYNSGTYNNQVTSTTVTFTTCPYPVDGGVRLWLPVGDRAAAREGGDQGGDWAPQEGGVLGIL